MALAVTLGIWLALNALVAPAIAFAASQVRKHRIAFI